MDCAPEDVFAVLENGWTYANWVVGAARIRGVDDRWPAVGSRIYHSVGLWPLLLSDRTEVEEVDPPRRLQLRVRAWPSGEGRVTLTCQQVADGTKVIIEETAISGPAKLIPRPAQDALLTLPNTEALRRLGYLAENGASAARRA
jgi:uncharacterized protein YndB with AHSA1/START domain